MTAEIAVFNSTAIALAADSAATTGSKIYNSAEKLFELTNDVPMMKNAAKTIGKRLYGILNAMRHSVSNGNAEALNSKIRLLRIKARGYRNRERFKLGVMFHYGKLNMAF